MTPTRRGSRPARPSIVGFALVLAAGCGSGEGTAGDTTPAGQGAASPATRDSTAPSQPAPPATSSGDAWVLAATGGHGVRIGMSEPELRSALGLAAGPGRGDGECRYLDDPAKPAGLFFMLERDTLTRIEARDSSIATAEGATVGSTEARVKTLYPGVEIQPHKYTGPTGHYLVVTPPGDSLHRIVFETDGNRVTTWRVGRVPAVQYVEGCS